VIIFAETFIQDSVVEFFHKKIHILIKAKKITQEAQDVKAYDIDAEIKFPDSKEAHIVASKLSFNPETFECHLLDNIKLVWDDVIIDSTHLIFKIKDYVVLSDVMQKGYYKRWTFLVSHTLYEYEKRMLTFAKGCEIFDTDSRLTANYGEIYLGKWLRVSKNVVFKNNEIEMISDDVKCYLGDDQKIKRVESMRKTTFKTRGNVTASGENMIYENDEIVVHKNAKVVIEVGDKLSF